MPGRRSVKIRRGQAVLRQKKRRTAKRKRTGRPFQGRSASVRTYRLFAVACCFRLWRLMDPRCLLALVCAERWADEPIRGARALHEAAESVRQAGEETRELVRNFLPTEDCSERAARGALLPAA